MDKNVMNVFKAVVIDHDAHLLGTYNTDLVTNGIVTDFTPTNKQASWLKTVFEPLRVKTMFTVAERDNLSVEELITRQVVHYFISYGLGASHIFDVTVDDGEKITMNFIRGVTVEELGNLIRRQIYGNAPIADVAAYQEMIRDYDVDFDLNKVKNNEMRIRLFNTKVHKFSDGDDAVRWIVFATTDETNLIKSKEVVQGVKLGMLKNRIVDDKFLDIHAVPLAKVFNRHKAIILAVKNRTNRSVINRISRMSKTMHVPMKEGYAKTVVARYAKGEDIDMSKLTIRDKFKLLNFISTKSAELTNDMYFVRNGKVYIKANTKSYDRRTLINLENMVVKSLGNDLEYLKGKNILMDNNVDYGLPISQKQAIGKLPFWTEVSIPVDGTVSAGIHWRNEWGASDLDLSAITLDGTRVGWGSRTGYDHNSVKFSGDVTSAYDGAMEFFTSTSADYLLVNNIYSGRVGCELEVVFGTKGSGRWIDDVMVREKITMESRNMIVGYVKGKKMVMYKARKGGRFVSEANDPAVERVKADMWTVGKLFFVLGIEFDTKRQEKIGGFDKLYDYDLSYAGFTFDKLEDLLNTK